MNGIRRLGGGCGDQATAVGYSQSGAPTVGELPLSGSSLLKWLPVCLPFLPSFSLCVGLSLTCLLLFSLSPGPFELQGSSGGCGVECVGKGLVRGEGVLETEVRGVGSARSSVVE